MSTSQRYRANGTKERDAGHTRGTPASSYPVPHIPAPQGSPLVRDVWTDDGFEGGSNGPELEIAEASGEALADTPDVGSGSQSDELQPRIGQGRESGPPIRRIHLALNQSFGDHPLNQAGDAAGGEKNAFGQVPHAQRMSWRTGEAEKDVVFAERDAVSLLQIHIEPPNDLVVRVEERLPSAKLGLA
jgi:hypothetical protein